MKKKINKEKLKILLIVPKYSDILNFNSKLENLNYNYSFPLGLAYISSSMKQAGYNVSIIFLNSSGLRLCLVLSIL